MPRIPLVCLPSEMFIAGFDRICEELQVLVSFSPAVTTAGKEVAVDPEEGTVVFELV